MLVRHVKSTSVEQTPLAARSQHWLLTRAARPLRFLSAGLLASVAQLGLLDMLVDRGISALLANSIAYLCGAQIAFIFHRAFTWHDRMGLPWWQRWWRYMGTIAATGLLSQGLFAIAIHGLPVLLASALATSIASVVNYVAGNLLIFFGL
jgi:putative flippase GtrA